MNKIVALFCVLLVTFCGIWVFNSRTPINNDINATKVDWGTSDKIEEISEKTGVSEEWILDPEIPENYVPVIGEDEVYMVVDNDGKVEKYRQREKQDDGSWIWKDINTDIPKNFVPVEGLEDVYSVMDDDGNVKYYKYIRNEDGTFSFIEVDKDGNIIDKYIIEKENEAKKNNKIPDNYEKVSDDLYAVKDENNVTVGYKEVGQDNSGKFYYSDKNNGYSTPTTTTTQNTMATPTITTKVPEVTKEYVTTNPPAEKETYTTEESYTESKISGGYKITYKYTIIKTYDKDGELLSTKKEGPEEIGRELVGQTTVETPNKALVESNIDNEIVRMTNGLTFKETLENDIIATLNAERVSQNLSKLSTDDNAKKLSRLFCSDMARYNHSDYQSQLYGTISQLINKYDIDCEVYAINIWRTTDATADTVHSRFQSIETSRTARMHEQFSGMGVSVIYLNGYYYVVEVLLG